MNFVDKTGNLVDKIGNHVDKICNAQFILILKNNSHKYIISFG